MKIVFITGSSRARTLEYLIGKGEAIVALITPPASRKNRRFEDAVRVAEKHRIPVMQVARKSLLAALRSLDFEVLLSCGYPYLIDQACLSTAKVALNVHPTLLPKYRGFRSAAHVIINGETKSGVTVHFISEEMDQGDILLQKEFPLTVFDTSLSMIRKGAEIEPPLVYEALQKLRAGTYVRTPQDPRHATTYPGIRTPKDSEIDWNRPLKELYNAIRACDPDRYPAFFHVEGQKVCVRFWRPEKPADEADLV